jgi:hypothetical protein
MLPLGISTRVCTHDLNTYFFLQIRGLIFMKYEKKKNQNRDLEVMEFNRFIVCICNSNNDMQLKQ